MIFLYEEKAAVCSQDIENFVFFMCKMRKIQK